MKKEMNIVITGGSSGLGNSIIGNIYEAHKNNTIWKEISVNVYNIDIQGSQYNLKEKAGNFNVHDIKFDFNDTEESKYQDMADEQLPATIDILINNCGVNYIEWIDKIDMEQYDSVFNINVRSAVSIVKNSLEKLRNGTILNIISNASDMAMTNSLAYNGSKGAMKIITKQMSRELSKTHNITVFGISPNKLNDTQMSRYIDSKVCDLRGWSKEEAQKYQVAGLPSQKETDKDTVAEFIVFLLSTKKRHEFLQGCILPYGGPMSN